MRFYKGLIVFSILLFAAFSANAEIAVIANSGESVSALTEDQAKAIFLKKNLTLPNGEPVMAVDLPEDNQLRNEFYEKVAGKTPSQLKAYWAKLVFTGKGTPNEAKSSEAGVLSWVGGGTGRIGYVSADKVNGSVKVLLRVP